MGYRNLLLPGREDPGAKGYWYFWCTPSQPNLSEQIRSIMTLSVYFPTPHHTMTSPSHPHYDLTTTHPAHSLHQLPIYSAEMLLLTFLMKIFVFVKSLNFS